MWKRCSFIEWRRSRTMHCLRLLQDFADKAFFYRETGFEDWRKNTETPWVSSCRSLINGTLPCRSTFAYATICYLPSRLPQLLRVDDRTLKVEYMRDLSSLSSILLLISDGMAAFRDGRAHAEYLEASWMCVVALLGSKPLAFSRGLNSLF